MSENQTGDYRPGRGKIYSSTELKGELGRNTFQRVAKDHVGSTSRSTEWGAERRMSGMTGKKEPTAREMEMVFEENKGDVRAMRGAKMSDLDIYNALKNR